MKRAVVLLSGGLDSATSLAVARDEGYETCALTVRYGQRHEAKLEAAALVAEVLGARRHLVVSVDLGAIGGSVLTYPDCRPEYVRAFEALTNLATKAAVEGRGRYRDRVRGLERRAYRHARAHIDVRPL